MTMQEVAQDPSISPNKFRKLFANKKNLNYMLNWFMTSVGKFKADEGWKYLKAPNTQDKQDYQGT